MPSRSSREDESPPSSWSVLGCIPTCGPFPCGRLLVAKAVVAGALIWACPSLVSLAALVGWIPVRSTSSCLSRRGSLAGGLRLHGGALLLRDAIATAYVAFDFTALLA